MAEKEKEKTAFTTRAGKFEFKVMPFGLKGAVATFYQLIDLVFTGFHWERHLQHLILAFTRLKEAKPLQTSKFHLVSYLGHIVGIGGLKMDPKKVETIQQL